MNDGKENSMTYLGNEWREDEFQTLSVAHSQIVKKTSEKDEIPKNDDTLAIHFLIVERNCEYI